jgi:hypothetical protein
MVVATPQNPFGDRSSLNRRILSAIICVICFLISTSGSIAQSTLRSEITPNSGHIDDLFIFTVTYEGQQERIAPQISAGGDFQVQLLGPKSSISIINGQVFVRQQFVYQLTPKREGTLKTPEVQATVAGQTLSAAPIAVTIKSGGAGSAPSGSQGTQPDQIFMKQSAEPTSAFVGQQIVNAITVYTRINLRGVRIEDDAADGFWQETISDGNNAQRTVNGVEYGSAQILRAIFALKAGELKIPAREALVQVPVTKKSDPLGSFDPFSDDFFQNFFQRTVIQEKKLTSNELTVSIKPLPPMPPELMRFSSGLTIVGDTSISAVYSDTPIKVGETKNVSIVITSSGHLNPLKSLPLKAPPGVKIYDGQTKVKHDPATGRLTTEKTFTYSVVPMQPGVLRVPGVSISYFDPESTSYKLATSADISLVVSGAPANKQLSGSGDVDVSQQPVDSPDSIGEAPSEPAGSRLPYLDKTTWESLNERVSLPLALLVLAAAVFGVGVFWLWSKGARSLGPRHQSTKFILRAQDLDQLEGGIRSWAHSRMEGLRPNPTFDEIRSAIRNSGADKSSAISLVAILDEIEISRYGKATGRDLATLKKELVEALRRF